MVIKGTATIAQYKIVQWVNENFVDGSIRIEFTGKDIVTIYDACGDSMKLKYDGKEVKEIE